MFFVFMRFYLNELGQVFTKFLFIGWYHSIFVGLKGEKNLHVTTRKGCYNANYKKILKFQKIEKTSNFKNINNHKIFVFLIKNYITLISYCEQD